MRTAVLGFDRGRHSVKAHLIINGQEFTYCAPSLAVPEPPGADPEGDQRERLIINGRPYLVGNRAQATSPDALFRTVGSKTEGQAGEEFRLSVMAALSWFSSEVDIEHCPLLVVTSAPDSEYDRAKVGLKETLTDSFQFQTGNRFVRVDIPRDQIMVARESLAPFWAQTFNVTGDRTDSPLLWAVSGRPGQMEAIEARALTVGIGFRDWNVAITGGGVRSSSLSGVRGVSEIYAALWDVITGPEVRYNLKNRTELDQILSGHHPIWSNRDPAHLDALLKRTVKQKGESLLADIIQWAGSPDEYHAILAAGGGCLMLRDLVQTVFPKAAFATQKDSAKGLAYAGMRSLKSASQ